MPLLRRTLKLLKYLGLGALGFLVLTILTALGYFIFFNSVSTTQKGPLAAPSLENISLTEWESQRTDLKTQFENEIYGPYPRTDQPLQVTNRKVLQPQALNGKAHIEELTLSNDQVKNLHLIVIRPNSTDTPTPIIITQNFCGNHNSFPFPGVSKPSGFYHANMCDGDSLNPIITLIMGKHLSVPPIEKIIDQGYAIAGFYPGEVAPDEPLLAPAYLEKVGTEGTIMAWAWGFNRVAEFLSTEPSIDNEKIAIWGHSRHGKSALVAVAFEDQVDLVISHQSGTGGASLGRFGIGEPIESITRQYPHWFSSNYRKYANNQTPLPIDQHQLMALAAPTPIILGNGQHDKWSDPQTAWRALEGAQPIYELYQAENNLTFHMRPGPHGTRVSDWDAFLAFLSIHFK